MNEKKVNEYSDKVIRAIAEVFNEESDLFIETKELGKDGNMTDFIHALSNMAPLYFYREITGNETDLLSFNHIANKLVVQNITIKK